VGSVGAARRLISKGGECAPELPVEPWAAARVDALAGRGHVGRGLDAPGVENAAVGLGIAAFGLPDQAPQETVELVKGLVLGPGGEVYGDSVDPAPRRRPARSATCRPSCGRLIALRRLG